MEPNYQSILQEALKLPPETRAALAGTLLESLDESERSDVEEAWKAEIFSRIRQIQEGEVVLVPWSEAKKKIFEE